MLFRVMNPHQRCLQAKVKYRNEPKQVMPKSEDLSRSLEINAIWIFDKEFPTIFNKSCIKSKVPESSSTPACCCTYGLGS